MSWVLQKHQRIQLREILLCQVSFLVTPSLVTLSMWKSNHLDQRVTQKPVRILSRIELCLSRCMKESWGVNEVVERMPCNFPLLCLAFVVTDATLSLVNSNLKIPLKFDVWNEIKIKWFCCGLLMKVYFTGFYNTWSNRENK